MFSTDNLSGCFKRTSCLLLMAVGMISGCQQNAKPHSQIEPTITSQSDSLNSSAVPSPQMAVEAQDSGSSTASEGEATTCQRQLLALSKVNPSAYAQKKAAFDALLSSASVYTAVRDDIGSQTRGTMDALYKYKTQKLCSDIEQSVRQSLISRGENFK
ncbi:MAG TPA: hypothetical protein VH187_16800 [Scandinavium sp.]|jgi:hypothetical protein|uniref:hypothetical protein n=1 Tax=Scandinavium sp. TaxID=2830653 RepID=UPI002E335809|nr:hypothetical protein [Scandinavium sp.]HEX4502796.1 hypothetical protein [Scandinavium sp.]